MSQQGVPGHYIRPAAVDWAGEFFAASNLPLKIGSALVPPVSYGVWSMLELAECDFVHPKREATPWGAVLALYLSANGKSALPAVRSFFEAGLSEKEIDLSEMPDNRLVKDAVRFAIASDVAPVEYVGLRNWLMIGFAGFATIPGGDSSGSEFVFGVDSFGALLAAIGGEMGVNVDDLMWRVPLVTIGHAVAQKSKQNGAKGIGRPKDREHMREMFDRAKDCYEKGLLYPWQEREPWSYGLDGHETADEAYRYAVLQHEQRHNRSAANG